MAQCIAHNRTGEQCKKAARPGQRVCHMHGGSSPQALRKAGPRQQLNELMTRELTDEERRHPWEILLDAFQRLDDMMRHGAFPDHTTYVEHLERVVRAGKALIDAKVGERVALAHERDIEADLRIMVQALAAAVDALLEQLPTLVTIDRNAWRQYALAVAHAELDSTSPHVTPTPPSLVQALPPSPHLDLDEDRIHVGG